MSKEQIGNMPQQPQAPGGDRPFLADDLGMDPGYSQGNQGMTAPVYDNTNVQHTGTAVRPIDAAEIYSKFQPGAFLSQKGMDYIKGLKEALTSNNNTKEPTTVHQLSQPPSSLAVRRGKWVILITFDEALPREYPNLPSVAYTSQAYKSAEALFGAETINIYNHQLVCADSYDEQYLRAMVTKINNMFTAATNNDVLNMTIDTYHDYDFDVNYSVEKFESFENQHNPHAVRPRANITMTVRAVKRNQYTRHNSHHTDFYETTSVNAFDIGTIGAYVDFMESRSNDYRDQGYMNSYGVQGDSVRYQPQIHMSFNAAIPDVASIIVLLAVAKTHLIDGGNWLIPFRTFNPDYPNIGNLVNRLDDNSPYMIENNEMLSEFVRNNTFPPVLFLDVIEGCSCIPGIENLTLPDGNANVVDIINQFLPGINLSYNTNVGYLSFIEYTGNVTIGGHKVDSSNADFLNLMLNYKSRKDELREFLQPTTARPEDKVEIIRKYFPDIRLTYSKSSVLLDSDSLTAIQTAIAATQAYVKPVTQHQGRIDGSQFITMGRNLASSHAVTGNSYQVSNPFRNIHGSHINTRY